MADDHVPYEQNLSAILSYTDPDYVCITDYTYDKEFYIATTNTAEMNGWETCVFCNDPDTDIREFESLVEMVYTNNEQDARVIHINLLSKWNTLGTDNKPTWHSLYSDEDALGIGEGLY